MTPRNRIIDHRKVRASELLAHELNPRTHSELQRSALKQLYDEIGFARSLLAYSVACPQCQGLSHFHGATCTICNGSGQRLKLIDGHLRRSMDPDMEVDVEVLDVTDAEARALLLVIDPLAQLAGFDADTLDHLRQITEGESDAVASLWQSLTEADAATKHALKAAKDKVKDNQEFEPEQFLVIVECKNEREQVDLLRSFRRGGQVDLGTGLKCNAKIG